MGVEAIGSRRFSKAQTTRSTGNITKKKGSLILFTFSFVVENVDPRILGLMDNLYLVQFIDYYCKGAFLTIPSFVFIFRREKLLDLLLWKATLWAFSHTVLILGADIWITWCTTSNSLSFEFVVIWSIRQCTNLNRQRLQKLNDTLGNLLYLRRRRHVHSINFFSRNVVWHKHVLDLWRSMTTYWLLRIFIP